MAHHPQSLQATVTCVESPQKTYTLPILASAYGMNPVAPIQRSGTVSKPPSPLPSRTANFFLPSKYVAVAAQVVYYGVVSTLPLVSPSRVTITDYQGNITLDTLVRPTQLVHDYRTTETGLRAIDLATAPTFVEVQKEVAARIRGKIIVGYALWDFLAVLGLSHPAIDTRDTALFMPFRRSLKSKPNSMISLVTLVKKFIGWNICQHGDVPVERARAALDLFRSCERIWEEVIATGAWPCALPPEAYANCFS